METALLGPRQVADRLGIGIEEAVDLILDGGIRTVLDDAVPRVPAEAIDEYRREHQIWG